MLASGVSQAASIASGRAPGLGWLLSAGTPFSVRSDQTRPSSEYPRQRQGRQDRPLTPSPSKDHPQRTMPRCWLTHRRDISAHGRLPRHPSLTRHSTRKRHASPSFLGDVAQAATGKAVAGSASGGFRFRANARNPQRGLAPPRAEKPEALSVSKVF